MKPLDFIVFGATGFSGKLVVKETMHLLKNKGNFKWGVAGRSETKLKTLLQDITVKTGEHMADVSVITADASDEKTLNQMARKARVIINCVGPYNFYGEAVVKACVEEGTHLIDIAGELKYMTTIRLKYDKSAAEKGVYIVNACGAVSMPVDIGILHFLENFEGEVNCLELYSIPHIIGDLQVPVTHYGTWESYIYDASFAGELKQQCGKEHSTPVTNMTPKLKQRSFLHKSGILDAWCLPYISSDNAVAQLSQHYFYENEKKQPVQIQTYIGFKKLWVTLIFALMSLVFVLMTRTSFTRKLLLKYSKIFSFGFVSHEVPEDNMVLSVDTVLSGEGWSKKRTTFEGSHLLPDKTMVTKVSSKYSAYTLTAMTSVLSAITILKEAHKLPSKGGIYTPATAFFNTSLQKELELHGIKFEVISTKYIK